eukprot:12589703-Ditylum_brightwellii.AAC.1
MRTDNKKNHLTADEMKHYGDKLTPNKDENNALIRILNVQLLPQKRSSQKNFDVTHTINNCNFSHLGLAANNVNWHMIPNEDAIPQMFR